MVKYKKGFRLWVVVKTNSLFKNKTDSNKEQDLLKALLLNTVKLLEIM